MVKAGNTEREINGERVEGGGMLDIHIKSNLEGKVNKWKY
jgi:hypothetical protein